MRIARDAERHVDLQPVWEVEHFTLLAPLSMPAIVAPSSLAVVIGSLFDSSGAEVLSFDEKIWVGNGLHGSVLLAHYWGGYIAFMQSNEGCVEILRDPSGTVPCYYMRIRDSTVLASDLDLLLAVADGFPEIDWSALILHLRMPGFWSGQTCLRGILELQRGFGLTLRDGLGEVQMRWSPWEFVSPSNPVPSLSLARELRSTVEQCVRSLSHSFYRPLVLLSGGLDSSIVAASLQERSHELTCITFHSRDPVGDERSFARAVANGLGARLVEYRYHLSDVDVGQSITEHLPRPNGRAFMQSVHLAIGELIRREGVDAIFDGQGGDNVFSYSHSARPIADRLLEEGISAGTWRTLGDICRMTKCSYWEAAIQTMAKTWQRAKPYRWYQDLRFLNHSTVCDLPEPVHPWFESTLMSIPGKEAHVASIARTRDYLEGGPARASIPWVSPLVSQPVMELCLRIPSWNWCEGGRDRAVARQAFQDVLPRAVARRTMKGGPDGFMVEIFEANRGRLKEILLGGLLEQNGVLDRQRVESFLGDPRPPRNSDYHRLLSLADAEIWASRWVA